MSQPFTVHQFHTHTAPGDAITEHMVLIRRTLKDLGIGGEIFSSFNSAPEVYQILPFVKGRLWNGDLLIIHHSQGNPKLEAILEMPIAKAVLYHNITPPAFFKHDSEAYTLCIQGREQLERLKNLPAFSVSHYNIKELKELNYKTTAWLPLLDLSDTPPPETTRPVKNETRQLLFIGRICPHKNQAQLIETLYFLEKSYPGSYRLVLVGKDDFLYRRYLNELIHMWGLEKSVEFKTKLSSVELETLYRQSDAFVCLSQHEGFCVPLVEAIKFGLPIFAAHRAAISETLANAGVHLISDVASEIAEAVHATLSDSKMISAVLDSQNERFQELKTEQTRFRMGAEIQNLLKKMRFKGKEQPLQLPQPNL